jgi:tetratricopeptide (TPR) repeat protein
MAGGLQLWSAFGRTWSVFVFCAGALGCPERARVDPGKTADREPAPAAPLDGADPTGQQGVRKPAPAAGRLPWHEDAPEQAIAEARAAGKPLLVDLWAPWCHTCLSMKNFVVTAANLPDVATRFVLLSVDTERPSNAGFLSKFPAAVWPTFYVLSPDASEVLGRWLGAASPAQLVRFLADAERTRELGQGGLAPDDPRTSLLAADALATRGKFSEAAAEYARALRTAPPDWPRRPETLVAQMTALSKANDRDACLELASTQVGLTGSSASAVDFASYALDCAGDAPAASPTALRIRRAVERQLAPLCSTGSSELSPDDRADACDKLSEALAALGDAEGARGATLQRLSVLEAAAAGKPDDVAVAYDWARTGALIALDRAPEALALAIARERALPQDYNPPHYQARSYKALGKWDEGLAALERALALAYGPRRVGLLTLKADLLLGAGRREEAVRTLREQLSAYRALPEGQKKPAAERQVEERLRAETAGTPPVSAP